jgi:hypothetical protein
MIRLLMVTLLLVLAAPPAAAQYGPPIYAGGGLGYGQFDYLFPPGCNAPRGHSGFGPDVWLGVRLRQFRVVARAGVVAEANDTKISCVQDDPPSTGTFVSRNYETSGHSSTHIDLRGLYSKSFQKFNVAGGVFAGRVSERHSNYYGATIMLGYGSVGIAADYSRRSVNYEDVAFNYTDDGPIRTIVKSGAETAGGIFLKAYVQMMR